MASQENIYIVETQHEDLVFKKLEQDQNLITKYQKQISSLEEQQKVLIEGAEKEKQALKDALDKKNIMIDSMRVKNHRYEFAVKEAILFLSKPMEYYEQWLKGKLTLSPRQTRATSIASNNGTSLPGIKESSVETGRGRSSTANPPPISPTPSNNGVRQREASAPNRLSTYESNLVAISPISETSDGSNPNMNMIQVLECVRLSLTYLKNAQNATINAPLSPVEMEQQNSQAKNEMYMDVSAQDSETYNKIKTNISISNPQGTTSHPSNLSSTTHKKSTTSPTHSQSQSNNIKRVSSTQQIAGSNANLNYSSAATTSTARASSKLVQSIVASVADGEVDEGDIAFGMTMNSSTSNSSPSSMKQKETCVSCREHMLDIDRLNENINALKRDVCVLANLLDEEKAARERVQFSKDMLDQELEELTAQLFDQANNMVIEEARLRDELETTNKELEGELTSMIKKFEKREEEFKKTIAALEAAKLRSQNSNPGTPYASNTQLNQIRGLASSFNGGSGLKSTALGTGTGVALTPTTATIIATPIVPIDMVVFHEFHELLEKINTCNPFNVNTLLQSSFIKRVTFEDIDPCLSYSYLNPVCNHVKTTTISYSFKKKIHESAINLLINIRLNNSTSPFQIQPPSETLNNKPVPKNYCRKSKCSMCGVLRDCDSSFTLGKPPAKEKDTVWYDSCRFCREKLASVYEFYSFIYNLRPQNQNTTGPGRLNHNNASILGMFKSIYEIRKRINLSKYGGLGLLEFNTININTTNSYGYAATDYLNSPAHVLMVSEWEKYVEIM